MSASNAEPHAKSSVRRVWPKRVTAAGERFGEGIEAPTWPTPGTVEDAEFGPTKHFEAPFLRFRV